MENGNGNFSNENLLDGGFADGSLPDGGYMSGDFPNGDYINGSLSGGGYANGNYPGGGYVSGNYPNGGFTSGGYANGSLPDGGSVNGTFPNRSFADGNFPKEGFANRDSVNGNFPAGGFREPDFRLVQQNVGETVYLVTDMGGQMREDTFALKMMAHNRMVNIVQTQVVRRDDRRLVQFNITGLMKLSGWLARPRAKRDVMSLFNSLANAFEEADAYMLDMRHLLLDWEYVYLDRQGNCMLLYLPFDHMFRKDQIVFLQEIVGRVQPDYQERDAYLFDILNAFSRGGIRKLSDFREILKKSAGYAGSAPEWNSSEREAAAAAKGNAGVSTPRPQGMGRSNAPREEVKEVPKKEPSVSRIPIVNIPGREPGGKAAVPVPEQEMPKTGGEGIGTAPEKSRKGKRDTERKGSPKEGKKGFFKKEGKKQNASQKTGIFGRQNNFQNGLLIPGRQKTGQPDGTGEEYPVQPGAGAGNMAGDNPGEVYEGYENTVVMPEPAGMAYPNGQAGGYAGMGVPDAGQGNMTSVMQRGNQVPSGERWDTDADIYGNRADMNTYAGLDMRAHANGNSDPDRTPYAADMGAGADMPEMDEECTMMLEQPRFPPVACLVRRRDGTVFRMGKDRTVIGSGNAADICIRDNHAISRNHAALLYINGEYYLEDNQSKNGSFINGRRIQPGVREAVYDSMVLKFANEDFVFSKHGR